MLDLHRLDKKVLAELISNGWTESRKVDLSGILPMLREEGYRPFAYALEILESFGNLEIRPSFSAVEKERAGDISFDVLDAASGEFDRIDLISNTTKDEVFPLGMVYGQWFLYVGKTWKCYMSDGKTVYLLGNDFVDFLENTLLKKRAPIQVKS